MERLIDQSQLQAILERGLVTGKWSIAEFNRRDYWSEIPAALDRAKVLPSSGFLKDHPQFLDMNFRDLPALQESKPSLSFLSSKRTALLILSTAPCWPTPITRARNTTEHSTTTALTIRPGGTALSPWPVGSSKRRATDGCPQALSSP